MRLFSVVILAFFISCSSTSTIIKKHMDMKKGDLLLNCKVKGADLFILVKNNTNSAMIIDNPCAVNTYVKVKSAGKEVDLSKRIKPNPECANMNVEILSQEEHEFFNPIGNVSLTELYNLEPGFNYEIEVVYYPTATHLRDDEGIKSPSCFFTVN